MSHKNREAGQSLIETITAIFILTMALSAGLGLAIQASTTSSVTRDQIIASNLAKEGLEVVRMQRDSNWLMAEDLSSVQDLYEANGGCAFPTSNNGNGNTKKPCYPEAFTNPFNLASSTSNDKYRVSMDNSITGFSLETANGQRYYLLCLQPDGTYRHNDPGGSGVNCSDPSAAAFARKVTITKGNINFPYTDEVSNPDPTQGSRAQAFGGHSPEKIVTSIVVWHGRRCPEFPSAGFDPANFSTPCKVVMTERLTNWKDYR